ncbi:hypothetical protein MNBD_GAMMA02-1228 [hydrothermal vent metagenome]|uniref:Uncharacterized protein n=1 Tax=hydrothermal vent metagenome TaxID=652676 RepID=A0A3B0WDR4_9ZZZZ
MTHPTAPSFPSCPTTVDSPNQSQYYEASDRIYLAAYYSDQLENQLTSYVVLRPDNSVVASWTHASNALHYAASYWYWFYDLPSFPQMGRWTFKATYESQVAEQYLVLWVI